MYPYTSDMVAEQATGLALVFELADFAAALVAQRYRREHPDATDRDVGSAVAAWYAQRPGAPSGDGVGRVISLPRPR